MALMILNTPVIKSRRSLRILRVAPPSNSCRHDIINNLDNAHEEPCQAVTKWLGTEFMLLIDQLTAFSWSMTVWMCATMV